MSFPNYKIIDPLVEKMAKYCNNNNSNIFNSFSPLEDIFLESINGETSFDENKFQIIFEKNPLSEDLLILAGFEKKEKKYMLKKNTPIFVLQSFLDSLREKMYQRPELYQGKFFPANFSVQLGDKKWIISKRYEIKKIIGQGAYGLVVSAYDKVEKKNVAIKKIFNTFEGDLQYQKRILREIKVMNHFKEVDGLISIVNLIPPTDYEEFEDVYIVMDMMDGDLRGLIKKSNQEITDENVQYFLYQILLGVYKLHSANVLHRDLKPSNLLLNSELDLCICDFGLSRGIDIDDPTHSTLYVATRWYRAPELLLQYEKSSKPLDIWSIGCILGELLQENKRTPLFRGENTLEQLLVIIECLGTPKEEDMRGHTNAIKYIMSLPLKEKKLWEKRYPKANPLALDMLDKMLHFDPQKRITVEEALRHKYLEDLFEEEDLIKPKLFDYQFDDGIDLKFNKDAVKQMIYDEIIEFNKTHHHVFGDAKYDDDEDEIVVIENMNEKLSLK
eukprot:gene4472-7853_t